MHPHTTTSILRAALAFLASLVLACTAQAAEPASADDTAKFLAGIAPAAASPLATLTKEASWQQHAKQMDQAWKDLDARQLSKVRAWSKEHLKSPRDTLFYMFSGPDFLYANAFFPDAKTIVMSGLEPVGPIPEINDTIRKSLPPSLDGLRGSINTILRLSFFITKEMSSKLTATRLQGTLPVIYVFLARAGMTVHEASPVLLNRGGEIVPPGGAGSNTAHPGAKIVFSGADGAKRTLYYFKTDVSNAGVDKSGFLKFCQGLGTGDALVKSASYLMHIDAFSKVRDFLLTNAATIVQDDSGVPLKHFKPETWQVKPFGAYPGPISIFSHHTQPKLRELYQKEKATKLDFGVGYRWRAAESTLLVATRKDAPAATPAKAP